MAVQPDDFLRAAQNLEDGDCITAVEPRARTIFGRLYYASFHAVREAVRAHTGDRTFDPESHSQLSRILKGANDPDVGQLGLALDQLRRERSKSDYRLTQDIQPHHASIHFSNAHHVTQRAAQLAPKFPRIPSRN